MQDISRICHLTTPFFQMMSESGGTENPGMSTGVTSLENDRALDQDNLKRHWIEQPPAQSIGESKVRIARNKKDTTWVRFEEDDGSEGAATIQPSSIEVVATKALQQQAIIKDAKWGTTSSGTSEQAKNNANLQQKDQSGVCKCMFMYLQIRYKGFLFPCIC